MRGAPPPHSVCLSPKARPSTTPRAEVPDPRPPCMPVHSGEVPHPRPELSVPPPSLSVCLSPHSGEVPDPRPELSIAINMEIVLASSVWDVVTTAAGGKLLTAAFDGVAGAELLGISARWEGAERREDACTTYRFRVKGSEESCNLRAPILPSSLAHLHLPHPSPILHYV